MYTQIKIVHKQYIYVCIYIYTYYFGSYALEKLAASLLYGRKLGYDAAVLWAQMSERERYTELVMKAQDSSCCCKIG